MHGVAHSLFGSTGKSIQSRCLVDIPLCLQPVLLLIARGEASLFSPRVGCFAYSPVDGAAANALPDPVPQELREERQARFMQTQAAISAARLARKVGTTLQVLVDSVDGDVAVARSSADAPEIDGVVRIAGAKSLRIGEFATVTVTGADAHDLVAARASH